MTSPMPEYAGVTVLDESRYGHWRPLCSRWQDLHRAYASRTGEVAFHYTERTNVGMLATAAWMSGLVALEEYQVQKNRLTVPALDEADTWFGRCDLWLHGAGTDEVIEAKQEWVHLLSPSAVRCSNKALAQAIYDAESTIAHDTRRGTGIAFVLPYLPGEMSTAFQLRAELEKFVTSLHGCECGLVAWFFPSHPVHFQRWDRKNYTPGVVMLVGSAAEPG